MFAPDFETKLLLTAPMHQLCHPDELPKVEAWIRNRALMVRSGVMKCPSWFQEQLNRLDSRLRCWWDSEKNRWMIDRLQDGATAEMMERAARYSASDDKGALLASAAALAESGAYYMPTFSFAPGDCYYVWDEFGLWTQTAEPVRLDRRLIEYLRENDMTRYSPAEYRAIQEERARKQRLANEEAGHSKVMTVIDNMSPTQIKNFLEVSAAVQRGETVIPHGEDLKILERMEQGAERAQRADEKGPMTRADMAAMAVNPTVH